MSKLQANALAVALAFLLAACSGAPPSAVRTPTTFVITKELPNGMVDITISPSYTRGSTLSIPVRISATRGSVYGPLTARIMASGINEAGLPAEVLVRELTVAPVTVTGPGRLTVTLTWDTRDTKGVIVPADAYSLVLEVRSDDGGASRIVTAGATLELR